MRHHDETERECDAKTKRRPDRMPMWWEQAVPPGQGPKQRRRAVAYYRHSAEIGQENSVEI
jgi:hypothetical protein